MLGRSPLEVSVLGLGCWPLGGGEGWGGTDEAQAIATIHEALGQGVNFFDTAESYNDGRSEEIVGKALVDRRDRALIATKISPTNTEPDTLRRHLEASLVRLQTGYVDFYQVHWPIREHSVQAAFEALDELRREGKVRFIGVSNHGVENLEEVLETGVPIVSNQLHYSLASRAIEFEIQPECHQHGIGIIAYMALLQGVLAGIYDSPDEVPDFRRRTRHFEDRGQARHGQSGAEDLLFTVLTQIRAVSEQVGAPMAQLALAWVMAKSDVDCVLVGGRKPEQLQRNVRAARLELSDDTVARLDEITEPLRQRLGANADYWQTKEDSRMA